MGDFDVTQRQGDLRAGYKIVARFSDGHLVAAGRTDWTITSEKPRDLDDYLLKHHTGDFTVRLPMGKQRWVAKVKVLSVRPLVLEGIGEFDFGKGTKIRSATDQAVRSE
jgi:hypothetical protein